MKKIEISYWQRIQYSRVVELEDKEAEELLALNNANQLDWQQQAELEHYMRRDDIKNAEDIDDHLIKEVK